MNVLFVSPNSPYESIGGVERYISNLISYSKNQKKTNIILLLATTKKEKIERADNLTIYHTQALSPLPRDAIKHKKEVVTKSKAFGHVLVTIIKKHKIHIICAENFHVGLPPAYSFVLNITAGLHYIPLILRLHSFSKTELQSEIVNQLMWKQISCISRSVAGDCFQKGADINCLSTDYLGVNTKEFYQRGSRSEELKKLLHLPLSSKIVLSASRIILGKKPIIHQKGLVNAIRAISKLVNQYPELHYVIAVVCHQ